MNMVFYVMREGEGRRYCLLPDCGIVQAIEILRKQRSRVVCLDCVPEIEFKYSFDRSFSSPRSVRLLERAIPVTKDVGSFKKGIGHSARSIGNAFLIRREFAFLPVDELLPNFLIELFDVVELDSASAAVEWGRSEALVLKEMEYFKDDFEMDGTLEFIDVVGLFDISEIWLKTGFSIYEGSTNLGDVGLLKTMEAAETEELILGLQTAERKIAEYCKHDE